MDDAVDFFVLHQLVEGIEVANVHLDKLVVGFVFNVFQVGQVAGIGQLVQVDDVIFGVFVYKQSYDVGADEAGTTGDDDVTFHILYLFL